MVRCRVVARVGQDRDWLAPAPRVDHQPVEVRGIAPAAGVRDHAGDQVRACIAADGQLGHLLHRLGFALPDQLFVAPGVLLASALVVPREVVCVVHRRVDRQRLAGQARVIRCLDQHIQRVMQVAWLKHHMEGSAERRRAWHTRHAQAVAPVVVAE